MKKLILILLVAALTLGMAACGSQSQPVSTPAPTRTPAPVTATPDFTEFTQSNAESSLRTELNDRGGSILLEGNLKKKAPAGTVRLRSFKITNIEFDHSEALPSSLSSYQSDRYFFVVSGSFSAYDKYDKLVDLCTFDVTYCVYNTVRGAKVFHDDSIKVYT